MQGLEKKSHNSFPTSRSLWRQVALRPETWSIKTCTRKSVNFTDDQWQVRSRCTERSRTGSTWWHEAIRFFFFFDNKMRRSYDSIAPSHVQNRTNLWWNESPQLLMTQQVCYKRGPLFLAKVPALPAGLRQASVTFRRPTKPACHSFVQAGYLGSRSNSQWLWRKKNLNRRGLHLKVKVTNVEVYGDTIISSTFPAKRPHQEND